MYQFCAQPCNCFVLLFIIVFQLVLLGFARRKYILFSSGSDLKFCFPIFVSKFISHCIPQYHWLMPLENFIIKMFIPSFVALLLILWRMFLMFSQLAYACYFCIYKTGSYGNYLILL